MNGAFRIVYTGDFSHASQYNNLCCAEVATSCDFITILVQFVSAFIFCKEKFCMRSKVKLLLKLKSPVMFHELHLTQSTCDLLYIR